MTSLYKNLLIIPASALCVLAFAPSAYAQSQFGTDTRSFNRIGDTGFQYRGGYKDDFFEYDRTPNGEIRSYESGTSKGSLKVDGDVYDLSTSYYTSADLRTGELKAFASDPALSILSPGSNTPSLYTGHARSNASLFETITLDWSGYDGPEYVSVVVKTAIDGNYRSDYDRASGTLQSLLTIGNDAYPHSVISGHLIQGFGQNQYKSSSLKEFDDGTYGLEFNLNHQTKVLTIFNLLSVDAYGSEVDYSHTSKLSLSMPDGLKFTSASGVFLSEANISAVPEASTWTMMLIGFGSIGGMMRRRRSAAHVQTA